MTYLVHSVLSGTLKCFYLRERDKTHLNSIYLNDFYKVFSMYRFTQPYLKGYNIKDPFNLIGRLMRPLVLSIFIFKIYKLTYSF